MTATLLLVNDVTLNSTDLLVPHSAAAATDAADEATADDVSAASLLATSAVILLLDTGMLANTPHCCEVAAVVSEVVEWTLLDSSVSDCTASAADCTDEWLTAALPGSVGGWQRDKLGVIVVPNGCDVTAPN